MMRDLVVEKRGGGARLRRDSFPDSWRRQVCRGTLERAVVIRGDKIEGTKHSSRRGDLMAGSVDGQRGLLRYASLVQRCLWKGRRVATVAYSSSSPLSRSHNRVVSVKPCLVTADRLAARNRSLSSRSRVIFASRANITCQDGFSRYG